MKILNLNKFRPRSDNTYTTETNKQTKKHTIFFDVPPVSAPTNVCCQGQRDRDRRYESLRDLQEKEILF